MASGIYQIENQINRKCYIGSAMNVHRRWQAHLSVLQRGQHGNRHLQRAFDRYGQSAFEFSILEHVEDSAQLISREQHYFDTLSPEYNIAPTAGSSLGIRHTLQSRQNMSLARIGKPHPHRGWHFTEDTRQKLSEALTGEGNPNYGKRLSDQHRRKISEALIGKRKSEETRRKMSEAARGKHPSEQTKRKISNALSGERNPNYGKHLGEETRKKISEALSGERHYNFGKHLSRETRARLSKANSGERNPNYGKHHSVETRRKISEAQKAHWSKIHAEQNHHTGDFQDAGHELAAEEAAHGRDV